MARPQRIPDYSYVGEQRYVLTFCTEDRKPHFTTHAIVDRVINLILQTAGKNQFAIIAYVVMPDHVHMLVDGESDDSDLELFMKLAKQKSGSVLGVESVHARRLASQHRTEAATIVSHSGRT